MHTCKNMPNVSDANKQLCLIKLKYHTKKTTDGKLVVGWYTHGS